MSDHTAALPDPEPGSGSGSGPGAARRTSRGVIAVVASVVAVVLVAVGGFAAWRFFGPGGPRPAEVLPDSTFALVTVDLDPSGGQKVEALKTLRKFPSLREHLVGSDLMKSIFDEALGDGPCKELDYERDVQPWIGSRAGIGGVLLGDDKPAPVMALQVKDAAKAKTGFAELAKCSGADDDEEFGWTVGEDYILVSDSTNHAEGIAAAAKKSSLASDDAFQKWTEEAGGDGILNAYLAPKAAEVFADTIDSDPDGIIDDGTGEGPGGMTRGEVTKVTEDFKGAAAVLRFADGGIELAFAGGGAPSAKGRTVGDHVGALPEDTAAVLALAVPEGALDGLNKNDTDDGHGVFSFGEMLGDELGLDLPDDLTTLLGESLSLSLGGDAPADLTDVSGPGDLPLGLLVRGDEQKIKDVIAKAEAHSGSKLSDLPATLASEDGKVAIASTSDYADTLLDKGSLADSEDFKSVVSHLDEARAVVYVSLDNEWVDAVRDLAAEEDDQDAAKVADNLKALRALGASVWSDGDTGHGLVRLSLK